MKKNSHCFGYTNVICSKVKITMRKVAIGTLVSFALMLISGCNSLNEQSKPTTQHDEFTVGIVQKEIKIGMTKAEVAVVLGSPNIVSSAAEKEETWIYDKISSSVSHSKSDKYGTLLLAGASSSNIKTTSTQKTLTVIIKFISGKVHETKYHTSSF